jgi:hypothetical protein
MDEMEFTEAESNMNDLVSEYQQYQVTAMLWTFWLKQILFRWKIPMQCLTNHDKA